MLIIDFLITLFFFRCFFFRFCFAFFRAPPFSYYFATLLLILFDISIAVDAAIYASLPAPRHMLPFFAMIRRHSDTLMLRFSPPYYASRRYAATRFLFLCRLLPSFI